MINFIRLNRGLFCILTDRAGAEEILLSLDSVLRKQFNRVDMRVDYSNIRARNEVNAANERLLGILKADDPREDAISWAPGRIFLALHDESIDYFYFKIKEYLDSGFIFPSEILDLYSPEGQRQVVLALLPMED